MRITSGFVCLACATFGIADAADETGKWYINPQIAYTWVDEERLVDDDYNWAIGIGKHLTDLWSLEFNGGLGNFDGQLGELDIETFSLDALLVFNRASAVSPYFSIGAGYLNNDLQGDGESGNGNTLAQAGLGVMFDVSENDDKSYLFQIRPEFKYRYDWADRGTQSEFSEYTMYLGFAFNFGPPAAAPVAAALPAPPPPPAAPRDSDMDGVLDPSDRCPDTPRGTAVDAVGCTLRGAITLHGVTFEHDSATLTQASGPVLDGVATDLKKYPGLKIELQGHTDSTGSAEYNMGLSQRRAESVRDYLLQKGVSASQLTAKGYGESEPTESNDTAPGRAQNRRTVMSVLDNPGNVEVQGEKREF